MNNDRNMAINRIQLQDQVFDSILGSGAFDRLKPSAQHLDDDAMLIIEGLNLEGLGRPDRAYLADEPSVSICPPANQTRIPFTRHDCTTCVAIEDPECKWGYFLDTNGIMTNLNFHMKNPECYKCRFIENIIQLDIVQAQNDNTHFSNKKNPEDISLIIQYFLLGSLMLLGKKFNQLSYRFWGLDFILMSSIMLMSFQQPSFELSWLLSYTNLLVYQKGMHWERMYQILYLQEYLNYQYCLGLMIALQNVVQTIVFVNLLLILRNPFYPIQKRRKWYIFIILLVMILYNVVTFTLGATKKFSDSVTKQRFYEYFQYGIQVFFAFIQTVAMMPIYVKLCKNGTSEALKKKVLTQYAIILLVTLLIPVMNIIMFIIQGKETQPNQRARNRDDFKKYSTIARCLMYLINQLYIIIRALEPFVHDQIRRLLCCGKSSQRAAPDLANGLKDEKEDKARRSFQYNTDSLNSFINSAINIEYVYLILTGVKNFMDVNQNINNEVYRKIMCEKSATKKNKNSNQMKIDMKDLKILHQSIWDIDRRDMVLGENTNTDVDGLTQQQFQSQFLQASERALMDSRMTSERRPHLNIESRTSTMIKNRFSETEQYNRGSYKKQSAEVETIDEEGQQSDYDIMLHQTVDITSPDREAARQLHLTNLKRNMDCPKRKHMVESFYFRKSETTNVTNQLFQHLEPARKDHNTISKKLKDERQVMESTYDEDNTIDNESMRQEFVYIRYLHDSKQLNNKQLQIKIKSEIISHYQLKFQELMNLDLIEPRDIMTSFDNETNRKMIFKAGQGSGASGSFFFFSHDNKFIIKTLQGSERRVLIGMLDKYIQHMKNTDNKSLIARIYGLFTIKTNYFEQVDIIIMQNTANLMKKRNKTYSFDLKGSLIARKVKYTPISHKKGLLKDVNFLELNQAKLNRQVVNIHDSHSDEILRVIQQDCEFLAENGIMDYSLLLIKEKRQQAFGEKGKAFNPFKAQLTRLKNDEMVPASRNILYSKDGLEIYHIGIIDYLQTWNYSKKGEAFLKTNFLRHDKDQISAIPPKQYCKRFIKFMKDKVFNDKDLSKNYGYLFSRKSFTIQRNSTITNGAGDISFQNQSFNNSQSQSQVLRQSSQSMSMLRQSEHHGPNWKNRDNLMSLMSDPHEEHKEHLRVSKFQLPDAPDSSASRKELIVDIVENKPQLNTAKDDAERVQQDSLTPRFDLLTHGLKAKATPVPPQNEEGNLISLEQSSALASSTVLANAASDVKLEPIAGLPINYSVPKTSSVLSQSAHHEEKKTEKEQLSAISSSDDAAEEVLMDLEVLSQKPPRAPVSKWTTPRSQEPRRPQRQISLAEVLKREEEQKRLFDENQKMLEETKFDLENKEKTIEELMKQLQSSQQALCLAQSSASEAISTSFFNQEANENLKMQFQIEKEQLQDEVRDLQLTISVRDENIGALKAVKESIQTGFELQHSQQESQLDLMKSENEMIVRQLKDQMAQMDSNLKEFKGQADGRNAVQQAEHNKQLDKIREEFDDVVEKFRGEQVKRKELLNELEDIKGKVRVYARIRPFSISELNNAQKTKMCLEINDQMSLTVFGRIDHTYTFDSVFGPESTQQQVFNETKRLIQSSIDGFNVCIFAYGQTGSGKTFTIQGTEDLPGLVPRSIVEMFTLIGQMTTFDVKLDCTMVEIYKGELRDLLLSKKAAEKPKLEVKMNADGQVFIKNVIVRNLVSIEECNEVFERGLGGRKVRKTLMNDESSRSHLIFSIMIESTNKLNGKKQCGKLSFIDLAGSESSKKTGTDMEGQQEANAINQSLSALGNVISALASGAKFIRYKENILTRLMQDSLGGNAKTLMFVNASPSIYNEMETKNSLEYAKRVKEIKNRPLANLETKQMQKNKVTIDRQQYLIGVLKSIISSSDKANDLEELRQKLDPQNRSNTANNDDVAGSSDEYGDEEAKE